MTELAIDVLRGGLYGLIAGGVLGAVRHRAQKNMKTRLEACRVDTSYLEKDPVFLEAVLDIMPYGQRSKHSAQLCDVIARNANELVQCGLFLQQPDATNAGALRWKANRRFEGLQDASNALSHAHPNDLDIGAYTAVLQQCADNYIHNMAMSS